MDQLLERNGLAPLGGGQFVFGQPPSGVERHAEGADTLPPDQPFESELRGHDINGLGGFDQLRRVNLIGDQTNARILCDSVVIEVPPFAPADDIGMHLQNDLALWILG